jgi:hypothetical protein
LTKKKIVKQEGHIREPKAQDSHTEMSGHSSEDRGDLTAIQWMDKRDVHMLTNIHDLPQEVNFLNEQGNAIKPEDYNHHMHYVDKGDRMANSYSISCRIWKWTIKLFFICSV